MGTGAGGLAGLLPVPEWEVIQFVRGKDPFGSPRFARASIFRRTACLHIESLL
jgi:hypothetical protein